MIPAQAMVTLELTVPAREGGAVRRHLGAALGRARPLVLEWHDDAAGALAARGLALAQWQQGRAAGWRVERLDPSLPPGQPLPVIGEAATPHALQDISLPAGLQPVQRLAGRERAGLLADVALRLVDGRLSDGSQVARLTLSGPPAEVTALGLALAQAVPVGVPLQGLAGEALARAGLAVPRRRIGAPQLQPDPGPGEAFALAAGHLLGVLLHHAPAAGAGETGEPVHQMRVALRRLRALATVFRDAVACPELDALRPSLKALASALGPARDWDVFLAGTGQAVIAAFPEEDGLAALMAGAAERRAEAYAALADMLAGPALRGLAITVATMVQARPWTGAADSQTSSLDTFAAKVLAQRLRRVTRKTGDFGTQPEAALHDLRLRAKRLRYAAEVFAPLFPGRDSQRFLRRLAALQEALGHLNDGVVAAGLMSALADTGGTGPAGGLVRGYVAGRAGGTRKAIARAWKRLRKATPFWQ